MRRILALLVAGIQALWCAGPVVAAEVLALGGPVAADEVPRHLEALLDPGRQMSLGEAAAAADWAPVASRRQVFLGYRQEAIWLRMDVVNTTAANEEWVLHVHENFKQEFDTWVVHPGGPVVHALALTTDSPFAARPLAFPQMAAPFRLKPGEAATIYIRFWSEGSSLLPVSVETRAGFLETTAAASARNFVFYGVILAFIVAALVGSVVFASITALAFAAYAAFALLFVMHSDGTGFQYLYPHLPGFNSVASVVWGGGFVFFSALYARVFLRTGHDFPRLDRVLAGVMLVSLALGLSMFVLDRQVVKMAFVAVALAGLLICLGSGLIVAWWRFREVRFFVLAWTGAVLSSLLMNLIHFAGIDLAPDVQTTSMRAVMVIDAGLMGLAILDRYSQMRDRGQEALQESLRAAERSLDLSRRLSELERQAHFLESVSRQKDEIFANAIHDLRQPLHALRLRTQAELARPGTAQAERAETDRSFDYLENLISRYLDEMRQAGTQSDAVPAEESAGEDLSLAAVLAGIHEMFRPDAAEKELDLRLMPTSLGTTADPLTVMRIVANLVANAIKYTPSGRILIGCRRRGGVVSVEVHDTGPGLSAQEFGQALDRAARLERTAGSQPGEGYGLAIAAEHANLQGGRLTRLTGRRGGLSLAVLLPAAAKMKMG